MSSLSEHRWVLVGLALLVALGIAAAVVWRQDDVSGDREATATSRSGVDADDDGYFDDGPSGSGRRDRRDGRGGGGPGSANGAAGPRGGFRDRVGERAERWRSEVDVSVLGPGARALDPEQLVGPLDEGMDELAACMERHGGRRAFRDATRLPERLPERGADGGTRMRRRSTFDIRADGTVDPASVAFDPPIPPPFDECFQQHITHATFPAPGGEGVRVDIPIRRPHREPPVAGGDGGVAPRRR